MNQVLCKGGMHYVPQSAIVEHRNGRLICFVCFAMIPRAAGSCERGRAAAAGCADALRPRRVRMVVRAAD